MKSSEYICLLLVPALCIAAASCGTCRAGSLNDFISAYTGGDETYEAAQIRLRAARDLTREVWGVLPYPTLSLDVTTPRRSWVRNVAYAEFDSVLYRGWYENKWKSYDFSLSLRQPLPTGGTLTLSGRTSIDESEFAHVGFPAGVTIPRETGDQQFLTDVGVVLDQPLRELWRRGGEGDRARLRLLQAEVQFLMDSAQSARSAIDLAFDFMTSRLRHEIARREHALASSDALAAEGSYADGIISEEELIDTKIEARAAEIALIDAAGALAASRERMRLKGFDPEAVYPEDLSAASVVDTSLASVAENPEVVKVRCEVEIARVALKEKSAWRYVLPTVSLWYGLQGVGDDASEAGRNFDHNRWGGSLRLDVPLYEAGRAHDIDLLRADLKAAEAGYDNTVVVSRRMMGQLSREILALRATLDLYAQKVNLIERRLVKRKAQFEEGLLSESDLMESEIAHFQARMDMLEVMRKVNLRWVDYLLRRGNNPVEILTDSR
ncbi:MAG: TolC family protein [bacterium]|jgi:outer membrane protein TolC